VHARLLVFLMSVRILRSRTNLSILESQHGQGKKEGQEESF
jgi:hypothetical protein